VVGLLELPARISALEAQVTTLTESIEKLRRASPSTFVPMSEAASRLGVSLSTLRRRIRAGDVPVVRIGRSVRVDLGALRPADQAEVARLTEAARRPR
jgi:excisionase family DNA binding protein